MFNRRLSALALVLALIVFIPNTASGDAAAIVSLGADLTGEQKQQMLREFQVSDNEVPVIEVTNQEEYRYLGGVATPAEIGTKAVSCAYVEMREAGAGILVETSNITWVTPGMYASAAATAGVKDAFIKAAAPFPVSGTAALTGIIKGFEQVSGSNISAQAAETAHRELYILSLLGRETGEQDKVTTLVQAAKERVTGTGMNREQVLALIDDLARERGLELTEAQREQLVDLLERVQGLGLAPETLRQQLNQYITDNPGFFRRLFDWLVSLLDSLLDYFRV